MALSAQEILDLKEQLKQLKEARRTGVKRVIFNERDVTYKSDDDMKAAIKDLEDEIRAEEAGPARRRRGVVFAAYRSGGRRW